MSSNVSNQSDLNHLPTNRSTNFSNVNQPAFNENGSSSNKDTNGAMNRSQDIRLENFKFNYLILLKIFVVKGDLNDINAFNQRNLNKNKSSKITTKNPKRNPLDNNQTQNELSFSSLDANRKNEMESVKKSLNFI